MAIEHGVFLGTNILIDALSDHEPFARNSYRLISPCEAGRWSGYTSAISIATLYYYLHKSFGDTGSRRKIRVLTSIIPVLPVNHLLVETALNSPIPDFEDAIQHECAVTKEDIRYVITRNARDFRKGKLPIMEPAEF